VAAASENNGENKWLAMACIENEMALASEYNMAMGNEAA